MFWTIITVLILLAAIALYMFGGMFFKQDSKKASGMDIVLHKGVSALAIVLIAVSVCRLWTPVYLVHSNPAIRTTRKRKEQSRSQICC